MKTLSTYLEEKPLYYDEIDYDRFPKIYHKIKSFFKLPKVVHLVGTNGKGSTGRALAHLLYKNGKNVGHYSSPHILKFNERIWFNGANIDDDTLEEYHQKLQNILSFEASKSLSYFEYTTLLAMLYFCDTSEYIVLEAGLGGEYDATNVFEKILSIITPIGFDHESFLGSTIEDIAQTKINSVKNRFLVAKQHFKEVYKIAFNKAKELNVDLYFSTNFFDNEFRDTLSTQIDEYPKFFKENFLTALSAFELLGYEANLALLKDLKIFGRCQKIASNITIDVGHNPMAAQALKEYFRERKVNLVYNSYNDKEYEKILTVLKPIISCVNVFPISNVRVVEQEKLLEVLKNLGIKYKEFQEIKEDEEYLVFGSFCVVEEFLKVGKFDR